MPVPIVQEQLANLGYGALKVQTDPDVPVIPNIYFPLYKESLITDLHLDLDNPIVGNLEKVIDAYMGLRTHEGQLTVLGEPNTASAWFNMLLKPGVITGGGPYTHPYTLGLSPLKYTIDLLKGQLVERFWGVEAQSIEPGYDKDKMTFDIEVAARGSFICRTLASVDDEEVTFDTKYDPNPTKGLVATDKVRLYKADGSEYLDAVVVSVDSETVVTLDTDASDYASGDIIFLRAATATPTLVTLDPFLWARTEFRFADTAANAMNADQTHLEQGSKWKIGYMFEKRGGADRSGSFDPVSIPRLQGEAQLHAKVFFDEPMDKARFLNIQDRACVVRAFSGADKELRIILNALKQKTSKEPLETGKLIYNEIEYEARKLVADGQAFSAVVINSIAT